MSSNSCSAVVAHKFFHSQTLALEACLGKFKLSKTYLDAVYVCTGEIESYHGTRCKTSVKHHVCLPIAEHNANRYAILAKVGS